MVIDLQAKRAEREQLELEREFNPGPVRDLIEVAAAWLVLGAAFGMVAWVIWQQR